MSGPTLNLSAIRFSKLEPVAPNVFKARCPFHEARTPSFNLHLGQKFYKCFGCGIGGPVIGELQRHRRAS